MKRLFVVAALAFASPLFAAETSQEFARVMPADPTSTLQPQTVGTGWNYVHVAGCQLVPDATSGTLLYLLTKESITLWVRNATWITTSAPACQTGNLIAFYVADTTTGAVSSVVILPYK